MKAKTRPIKRPDTDRPITHAELEVILTMFVAAGASTLMERFKFTQAENTEWAELTMARYLSYLDKTDEKVRT